MHKVFSRVLPKVLVHDFGSLIRFVTKITLTVILALEITFYNSKMTTAMVIAESS